MQMTREDAQGGIESFVAEFAGNDDVSIALWDFDDKITEAVKPVVASAWPGYTLTPRGATALLDAIGKAVSSTRKHVAKNPAEKVVMVIVTDGGENASREYTKESVSDLIDAAKADGWEFVFLASDLSAVRTGASVGFAPVSYSATETSSTYAGLTRSVSSYVLGETASVDTSVITTDTSVIATP
jgi:hypothetical protein